MAKATTIRLTEEVFARLDLASSRTGMPVNSIVVAACLEWMQRHTPEPLLPYDVFSPPPLTGPPRWATIRRAVVGAVSGGPTTPTYPFARFTATARGMLSAAQAEAQRAGVNWIGTEHLLLAAFADATSHAALTLAALGVKEQAVRSMLEKLLKARSAATPPRIVPTARVKKVIELAFKLCGAAGDAHVSSGHVLLALATEDQGIAARVLKDAGATTDRIQAAMEALSEPEA